MPIGKKDLGSFSFLGERSHEERQHWVHWVLDHSDVTLPEMYQAVIEANGQDPVEIGSAIANPGAYPQDVVVIACEQGKHCVVVDQAVACRVVLFDWTGKGVDASCNPHGWETLSVATECKGHLMHEAWLRLDRPPAGHYMGFVDDDVVITTSSINYMLAVARIHQLAAVQASVCMSSDLSDEYHWLRHRPGSHLHRVPFVEIMAPFIRRDLLDGVMPFAVDNHSGYGLDRYAMPLVAEHLKAWRFAVVDRCIMSHVRRITSLGKVFSNGMTSKEEEMRVRQWLARCIDPSRQN